MITPLQVKKALSMRESGMAWPSIAEVIGEKLPELVAAVQKATGRVIRPEALAPSPSDPGKDVVKSAVVRGYVVEKNAAPPPPRYFADGSSALAAELEIGDVVRGVPLSVCNAIRRWLLNSRGWGSEFRWVDGKKEKVDLWVLEKPTARQLSTRARVNGRQRPDNKRRAAAE